MIEFGQRLRNLRNERNLTQKQLGLQIGVKESVISFYEVGERSPSPPILVKLCSALHTSADYLLGIDKNETVDISGLNEADKTLVCMLVDSLREKNQKNKKMNNLTAHIK